MGRCFMRPVTAQQRALLAGTFLLRDTGEQPLAFLLSDPRLTWERAPKGAVIYSPHVFRRCLGVVLSGRVQVEKGPLIMSVLEPGDLFGAAALFCQAEDYAATLTARSPCELLLLSQQLVEELMARFPQVGRNYVSYLSGRIRFLTGKIDALTAGSAGQKLAQYLLASARQGWAEAECSSTGLAKRLGVSRASLYRAYDALDEAGLIRRVGKRIELLDEAGLSHFNGGPAPMDADRERTE